MLIALYLLPLVYATLVTAAQNCSIKGSGQCVTGTSTEQGGCRYTLRYANAPERWGYSTMVKGIFNETTTELPPSCPQDPNTPVVGSTQSEDCLFVVVYAPAKIDFNAKLPVFVWLHGGSFVGGSASAPGLDGSVLATQGNMIVITLQYRLGVLGLIPPASAPSNGDPNLAVLDVINGLKAINHYVSFFGGDKDKIVVGGQSAGAAMIRFLWGAPEARGLFHGAILQSDPAFYGAHSTNLTSQMQAAFYSTEPMASCSDLKCLQNLNISDILDAQDTFAENAPFAFTGVSVAQPLVPTFGTKTLPFDSISAVHSAPQSLFIPPPDLPLLISTLKNEGGPFVQNFFPEPVPDSNATYLQALAASVGPDRAAIIANFTAYALTNPQEIDDLRERYENAVTDGVWRCSNRDMARQWAGAGGKVWVAEWRQGVQYPTNVGSYCNKVGNVCHQDDIYPTFHTAPDSDPNTISLENEVTQYWIEFITTLDPNPSSIKRGHQHPQSCNRSTTEWKQYTSTSTTGEIRPLGGDGQVTACPDGFWGEKVKFDWQLYG